MEAMRECQGCGRVFAPRRSDARYCSPACRAKASRERRSPEEPRPVPSGIEPSREDPDRLARVEERLLDLEGDVEAAEVERDGLHALGRRLEAALQQVQTAREGAPVEAIAMAAVEPVRREVAALKGSAVSRAEVAALRAAVERLALRLDEVETAPAPVSPEAKVAEIERAVVVLARRVQRLREEFDALVEVVGSV